MNYNGIGILLVEDNPGDARLVREMLRVTEYASAVFHSAASLQEAREAPIDRASIAMVLLDLNLPDSSGKATLLAIKEIYPDSAIIVLTGLNDLELAVQALREGAQNYLTKDEINASRLGRTLRFSIERHDFVQRLRQADRAVMERDRRFHAITEHSDDMLTIRDAQRTVLYESPVKRKLLGYAANEADVPTGFDLVHPADGAAARAAFEAALLAPGVPIKHTSRLVRKDGSSIHVNGYITNLLDVPEVHGVVSNIHDVSELVEAHDRMRSSEARLDQAQRIGRIGSWEHVLEQPEEGKPAMVLWSDEMFRLLGHDPGEMVPSRANFLGMVHPDDRDRVEEIILKAISTGEPAAYDHRVVHKDGTVRWLHEETITITDPTTRRPVRTVGTMQDITARMAAEEQLRTSQALMAEAQRVGHIGSWFLDLETPVERPNATVFWSDELFRIFGHEPGSFTASLERFIQAVHPEDRAGVQETVQRVSSTSQPIAFEHRIIRPDGTVRWLHEENSVVTDPATGRALRLVGTAQDITDRRSIEEELRTSEERFRAMIEGSTDGITLTDPQGKILYISPSILPMLGYTSEEMLGQPTSGILAQDKRPVLEELYRIIMDRPGATERMVFQLQHKDGSMRWMDGLFTNMLHMPAVRAVVTNYRDITATVALQKQHAFDRSNLSAMINSTQDLVWSVDRDLRLIAMNEPFVKALEYAVGGRVEPGDNLMMIPVSDGMSPTEHWRPLYQRALAGESFKVEEHMTSPVEAYMEMSYGPIHDQGSVVGVAAFSRDITAIRMAQLDLERSHLEARTSELQKISILDALPARVVLLNGDGIILAVNEAWRAFWKRSGRLGESCGIGEEYLPIARATIGGTAFLGQHVSEGVSSVLHGLSEGFKMECGLPAEEPTSWFHLRAAPLSGQKGAVVIHTDVTELRLMKEEVMRWNTQLEDRVVERTTELLLANEELEEATEKNKRLGREVAARTKELMSSISYASSIQRSLIPEPKKFGFFKDMGLVFRPRNVVSGDFLWCHNMDERFAIAVGDCTGHGVPGAMLSMLGHDLLNNIVSRSSNIAPPEMLDQIDSGINRLFLGSDGLNWTDGMDMAVVMLDKATLELNFSGAGLPLLVLREGERILLPGAKVTLGGHYVQGGKFFPGHTFQLRAGDRLCMFTDGFSDQFGGPQKKKLYRRHFFDLLVSLQPLGAAKAAQALERHFTEWMGTHEQVDDVLVLLLDV